MPLPIESARFDALKKLAAERFGEIKPAEEQVLKLSASTEDLNPPDSKDRPEVRAAFVRWLATDKEAAFHIDPLGLRVQNATITSAINLDACKIPFRLRFLYCTFQERFSLRSAELPALNLFGCATEQGIAADFLCVEHSIFLRKLEAKRKIRLVGAQIGGDLDCSGATLTSEGDALTADSASIAGGVFLKERFFSSGTIRFLGSQIGWDIDCSGAALTAEGQALNADGANIAGCVVLREKFSSSGEISLIGAQIGGDLA